MLFGGNFGNYPANFLCPRGDFATYDTTRDFPTQCLTRVSQLAGEGVLAGDDPEGQGQAPRMRCCRVRVHGYIPALVDSDSHMPGLLFWRLR